MVAVLNLYQLLRCLEGWLFWRRWLDTGELAVDTFCGVAGQIGKCELEWRDSEEANGGVASDLPNRRF